jgi:tetratricopeptide (TPR) repeat protein
LLDQALAALPAEPSADRALCEAWLAFSLYNSERREERKALARHAVELARSIGNASVLAECLMLAQVAVTGPTELDGRIAILDEIIALSRTPEGLGLLLDAHQERAWAHWERAELERAEADMHTVQRLAEQMHQPREKRGAVVWRAMRADAAGRFEQADPLLAELERAFPLPPGRANQGRAIRDFNLQMFRGQLHEALPGMEAYAAQFPLPVAWRCGLIASYAMAGRTAEARRELDLIAVGEFACIPDDHNWVTSHTRLASAACDLRDAGYAAVLYRKLAPYAERMCVIGIKGFCGGVVHKPLGELATVTRDYARAEQHLVRAIEANTRLGADVWVPYARLSYAKLLLQRRAPGDREHAFAQIEQARAFGRTCPMELLEEHAEIALRMADDAG